MQNNLLYRACIKVPVEMNVCARVLWSWAFVINALPTSSFFLFQGYLLCSLATWLFVIKVKLLNRSASILSSGPQDMHYDSTMK